APPTADFTIVSYYDSTGCTGCRMKLPFWNEFMNKVDSAKGDNSVELVMVAATNNVKELKLLVKLNSFSGNMVYDPDDSFNSVNGFPGNADLQAFLLDRHHRVIAMGNPVINNGVERLYLSKLGDDDLDSQDISQEEEVYEFDFGKVSPGEKVTHVFKLHNESADTLRVRDIITSCKCTSGTISTRIIPPGSGYELTAEFQDTVPGEFFRTISILFENKRTDIQFELSGEIIKNNY
ncbi:MAG: DUF1573 domain-containing protein, partial [Muribaculaceae bacterium]|nr:DUF1573 domain-containing protein [Muribaculaceae bacterium]